MSPDELRREREASLARQKKRDMEYTGRRPAARVPMGNIPVMPMDPDEFKEPPYVARRDP